MVTNCKFIKFFTKIDKHMCSSKKTKLNSGYKLVLIDAKKGGEEKYCFNTWKVLYKFCVLFYIKIKQNF